LRRRSAAATQGAIASVSNRGVIPATDVLAPASQTRSRRLFLALWPTLTERRRCISVARLSRPAGVGRLMLPENLHMTLAFLGPVSAARQARLEALLQRVQAAPFRLRFASLQCWRGGSLCCLTAAPVRALLRLHAQLLKQVRKAGIAVDARPLCPHITLARDLPRSLAATIGGDVPAVWLAARDFCLVASEPGAQGRRYRVLRRWPLR